MQTLEIFILLFLTLSILSLIAYKKNRASIYFLFIAIIITILQFFNDGLRWQLLPAVYLLPIVFFIYKLHQNKNSILLVNLFLLVWLSISILLPWAIPVFTLPEPDGKFNVGTETFHWIDSSRMEWFTNENMNDHREIMVQVWYPSLEKPINKPQPYMDFMNIRAAALASAGKIPSFFPKHLEMVKTNSYSSLSCLGSINQLPVVVFSHGITGSRFLHQNLFEYLASHGYVVVAPDHSYDSNLTVFPSGRTANYRSEITGHPDSVNIRKKQMITRKLDIEFIINQLIFLNNGQIPSGLAGCLDLERIALGGHSFGGATATFATHKNKQIAACFVLDSWLSPIPDSVISSGINIPFLFMGRPTWNTSDYPENYSHLDRFLERSSGSKYRLIIKKTLHLDYTDIPLLSPLINRFMDVGPLPPETSLPLINNLTLGFLEKYVASNKESRFEQTLNNELIVQ